MIIFGNERRTCPPYLLPDQFIFLVYLIEIIPSQITKYSLIEYVDPIIIFVETMKSEQKLFATQNSAIFFVDVLYVNFI